DATAQREIVSILRAYGSFLALAALIAYNIVFTPNFLSAGTLNANLTQVATIVIVAVGMTFVIATGGIDLSVGSLMAIAGVLAPLFLLNGQQFGAPAVGLALAIVAPLIATTLFGAFNGTLVTVVGLQPIIATLVLYLGGRGIAQLIVNGELREFRNLGSPLIANFEFIGLGQIAGLRFQIIIMLVVVAVAAWVLHATTFGRYVLATGGNSAAARLAGVPVNQVRMAVYCISGFLAGIAGLIVIAINRSSDPHRVGEYMELNAIAAVAVGGTPLTGGRATILGTFVWAMIIQLLRFSLIAHNIPDGITRMAIAGAIVVAVLAQRQR
ncbi:MAG TPA: ABC transporter permease, partial [Burkholderiaceae bacterium]|nr:ABC transporter permease [Burkholderiaceae bacterium]